jgi:hypothetical protein
MLHGKRMGMGMNTDPHKLALMLIGGHKGGLDDPPDGADPGDGPHEEESSDEKDAANEAMIAMHGHDTEGFISGMKALFAIWDKGEDDSSDDGE